ncbi:MAG: 4-hydroxy-tetrahydrodipicolinate reductase [Polyangiales bacterium]
MARRLAIHGAAGRLGLAIVRVLPEAPELELVAALGRGAALGQDVGTLAGAEALGVRITDGIEAAISDADVVIDTSHPTASLPLFERLEVHGKPVVIATTGFEAEGLRAIERLGRRVPVVFAPSYSQGVTVLFHLAARAAERLGEGFDAEIVEMHHRRKVDAPSGTAVELAAVVAEARGGSYAESAVHGRSGQVGARSDAEIGVLALRGGDVVGEHTLILAGLGERLELVHRATDRHIFARGAVRAARWVVGRQPGVYDMFDVMGVER